MKRKATRLAVLTAAATYIGTVVGAGFASGQEVLQFFGLLGPRGLFAIFLSSAGFFIFGFMIMEIGRKMNATSHVAVLRETCGQLLSPVLDFVTTFFLFGAFVAMVAGSGSALQQEYGVAWVAGAGIMAIISLGTVLFGLKGVVAAVSAVVPFLLAGVLLVSVAVLWNSGVVLKSPPTGVTAAVPFWPAAGLTYVSYNVVMAAPVLAVLGATLDSKKQVVSGALLGALGLALALFLVYLTIVSSLPGVLSYEVPMARLASSAHRLGRPFYILIFLAEVYTTAVANLYAFSVRLAPPDSPGFKLTAALTSMIGLWASSAGFSNLVRTVYPLIGWAGSSFLLALIVYGAKGLLRKKRR